MIGNKYKSTKVYCIRKGGLYVVWDGKSMTEKPQEGIRVSRTLAERKYPGFEMLTFPEAYDRWYAEQKVKKEVVQ